MKTAPIELYRIRTPDLSYDIHAMGGVIFACDWSLLRYLVGQNILDVLRDMENDPELDMSFTFYIQFDAEEKLL